MPAVSEAPVTKRHILLVGPYGVLGTGVVDAVAENPKWGITTAARRPVPTYRAQAAPPHVSVDLIGPLGHDKGLFDGCPLWPAATPYDQIANWAFVDWMLNFREETILSTIKIRQAGFADCIDTHQSFKRQLTRLRDMRIIP
jgi:hypothetical protein